MLGDHAPALPTEALAAWQRYCRVEPEPTDTRDWFDRHYPHEARPVLIPSILGPGLVVDLIQKCAIPLPAEQLFEAAPVRFSGPGWRFSDNSGLYLDVDDVRYCAGDESGRLATPDELLESPTTLALLAKLGTPRDIRNAVLGPYRDRLYLLMESPIRHLREQAIAALGGRRP